MSDQSASAAHAAGGGLPFEVWPHHDVRPRGAPLAAILIIACACFWAAGMASQHHAPPLDSAEQLVWSYSLEGGYWKHPPLPSWIMHAWVGLFGPSLALPFFAAQLSAAAALLLLWRLGLEFMSPARSLLAAAITGLVGYYGWAADSYNHNSALLPFQAATTLCFYFAVRRGQLLMWVLAGLFAGLALLVKYVALMPLAGLLLYVAIDRETRTARNFAGIAAAAGVTALVFAPHALWLHSHDYAPVQYAREVAVHAPGAAAWLAALGSFGVAQIVIFLPALLVLAWMAWSARHDPWGRNAPCSRGDRLFLWTASATPLALTVLATLVRGTEIAPRWGYNMFLLAGWIAVDALRWPERRTLRALGACAVMHAVLWLGVVALKPMAANALGWQGRSNFPGDELASSARGTWQARTDAPLRIVVSDIWLGGTLAAQSPAPLAVLADGEFSRAPWVRPEDVLDCGALVVREALPEGADDPVPGVTRFLGQASQRGEWTVAWAPWRGLHRPAESDTRIEWGVIPPVAGRKCGLP